MKKPIKKIYLVFLVIVLFVLSVSLWQYNNLLALYNGLSKPSEQLATELEDQRSNLQSELNKYVPNSAAVETVPAEIKPNIDSSTKSAINDTVQTAPKVPEKQDPKQTTVVAKPPVDATLETTIETAVSQMYVLQALYNDKISAFEKDIIAQYNALPKEKQNNTGKLNIVLENLGTMEKLEKEADTEVESLLSKLEQDIKSLNGDTEVVNVLRKAYYNEKEIKKAYYLSLLNN